MYQFTGVFLNFNEAAILTDFMAMAPIRYFQNRIFSALNGCLSLPRERLHINSKIS